MARGEYVPYRGKGDFKWMDWGLCNRANPNNANPEDIDFSQPGGVANTRSAIAICNTPCPVKADCFQFAMVNNVGVGVMGGTSEKERKPLLVQYRKSTKKPKVT